MTKSGMNSGWRPFFAKYFSATLCLGILGGNKRKQKWPKSKTWQRKRIVVNEGAQYLWELKDKKTGEICNKFQARVWAANTSEVNGHSNYPFENESDREKFRAQWIIKSIQSFEVFVQNYGCRWPKHLIVMRWKILQLEDFNTKVVFGFSHNCSHVLNRTKFKGKW